MGHPPLPEQLSHLASCGNGLVLAVEGPAQMNWRNGLLDAHEFDEACRRIREAYHAAYKVLAGAHQQRLADLKKEIARAKNGEDIYDIQQILWYEESRWREQTRTLGAMAIALLGSATKSHLDRQKSRRARTHPADPKGYAGGSQLQRQVTEYDARFDVDLERVECFQTVRELELARNDCLHNEGIPTENYMTQTRRRLLDEDEIINMSPEALELFIGELSTFFSSLQGQMREREKAAETRKRQEGEATDQ